MNRLFLLTIFFFKDLKNHPLQNALLLIGIAGGVAMIVAVEIANKSIEASFDRSAQSLKGKTTHQIEGSLSSVDSKIYFDLKKALPRLKMAPIVEGLAATSRTGSKRFLFLGVDPFSENEFRNYLPENNSILPTGLIKAFLSKQNALLLSRKLAETYSLSIGDEMWIYAGGKKHGAFIAGLLEPKDELEEEALMNMIILDIASAQRLFGLEDKITRIDLILPPNRDDTQRIRQILPEGVRLVRTGSHLEDLDQMTRSFKTNLRAMSLLAMLVGTFLIYNLIAYMVYEKRVFYGILRSIGLTKKGLLATLMVQVLFLGVLGSLIGLALGSVLGFGLLGLIANNVKDLYQVTTSPVYGLDSSVFWLGFLSGVLTTLLASLVAVVKSIGVPPVQCLQNAPVQNRHQKSIFALSLCGLGLLALGTLLLYVGKRDLNLSFAGIFSVVLGAVAWIPFILVFVMSGFRSILRSRNTQVLDYSIAYLQRSVLKTSLAVVSLTVAVSAVIGVGVMIDSFKTSLSTWLEDTLRADLYLMPDPLGDGRIDPDLPKLIKSIDGVDRLWSVKTHRLMDPEVRGSTLVVFEKDLSKRQWIWRIDPSKNSNRLLEEGFLLVSESLAWKNKIQPTKNPSLELLTDEGPKNFLIGGIFKDFSNEHGSILIHASHFKRFWNDASITGIAILAHNSTPVEVLEQEILSAFSGQYRFSLNANQKIKKAALEVFDRTFAITVALRALAVLVAIIGVFSCVSIMVLEQKKELGTLRAVGATKTQLFFTILFQSGWMGLFAGVFSIPTGLLLAWILVDLINKRSFGWSLEFHSSPVYFLYALVIALLAAIMAGFYPAWSFNRIKPSLLIKAE